MISGPITVTDNITGVIQLSSSGLSPGQNVTGTANYTVTQSDLDNGSVTNSAYATGTFNGTDVNSTTVTATVTAVQSPSLLINKSASPSTYDSVGDIITYTYNVTNTGNVNITGPLTVTDNVTGTAQILVSTLEPGQNGTGTSTYTINQNDIDSGFVSNAASATGTFNGTNVTSNTDTETVIANQSPALLTVKIASPTTYSSVGENITYTYNVNNTGNVRISAPINITDNKTGTFTISNSGLAPGQNVTGTANYTITQADLDNGSVTNEAFATGTFNGTEVNSTNVTATVTAIQSPALITVKIASPTSYSAVGQKITYNYTVTNSGNVFISGPITVTDNITGVIQLSNSGLSPGQNVTGTANYTITQADLDNGSVTNSAYATGTFNGTEVNSTNVTATVEAIQSPSLFTVKIASPENYSAVGDIITYTYNITNTGNVNIKGPITVTDNKTGIIQINNTTKFAYVTNEASNTVSVIDIANDTVIATIPVGTGPVGVAVSPDATKVYVPNNANDDVSVIDTATNTVTTTIPVGDFPLGVAFTPDGTKVYVTNYQASTVSVIDTATNTVTTTISGFSNPLGVAFTPDGTKAYIGNEGSGTVSVINTSTYTLITTITVGNNPYEITLNPAGTKAYVANLNSNTVSEINTTTDTVTDTIPVGSGPYGVAVTPDGTKLYVSNAFSDDVYVIDTTTNTLITTIAAGDYPDGVSITPDGTKLYVVNNDSNDVSVIDTATNTVIDTVPVGNGPRAFGKFVTPVSPPLILPPGQTVTGTANYTITQADLDSGFVTNSAFANGTFNGNNITSEPVNETVTANQYPTLLTVKIASPTTYSSVGENITYTYNVNNTGNVGISAPINVTDNRTGTFTISNIGLAPGQNVTGTANYTVTQDDLDSGSVTNAAFATGTFNGTEVNSANVTATVIANQNPALLTVKIASPTTYSSVGQNITYTYNVTNTGNVIITGPINVTDDKVGTVLITAGNLNPGQSATGTANYTVTQDDLDSGSVTNAAFATGTFNGTEVNSTNVTATVIANQNPALLTVKIASPDNLFFCRTEHHIHLQCN